MIRNHPTWRPEHLKKLKKGSPVAGHSHYDVVAAAHPSAIGEEERGFLNWAV